MMNIDLAKTPLNPDNIVCPGGPSAYSLNREKRIRELRRVTSENQRILRKLQHTRSCYSVRGFERDNIEKNYRVSQICRNNAKFMKCPFFISKEAGSPHSPPPLLEQFQTERRAVTRQQSRRSKTRAGQRRNLTARPENKPETTKGNEGPLGETEPENSQDMIET